MAKPGKRRVLVVDDSVEILEILLEILTEAGYQVETAQNGASALLRVGDFRPDVVVLDLKLPSLSGFDVIRCLREDSAYRDLPVLLMSGVFLDEEMIRAQVGEPDIRLFLKPIDWTRFAAVIESAAADSERRKRHAA
ncbi:MAG: response regulator [Candidatus Eisenbacteria bacterium]|nr:response regulator [Candidatus Eisenbacteria bacterium]